jgi:ketosteroid isomerase-like protein
MSLIPIRMDGWKTAEAGVMQVDTVAHCGDTTAGDFVYTVNSTDVATLWGARRAQWQKGQYKTVESLSLMRTDTPFPWTEIHPDSGTEFVNAHCVAFATREGLRMTRSRPYHKNDNCFVEERNGHIVRTYIGYARFDAREVVDELNLLYDILTPYLNHFVASKRIVSKERIDSRWKVTREKTALTPYQRALLRTDVSDMVKENLHLAHGALDPKAMRDDIDRQAKRVHTTERQYGIPR